MNASPQMNSPVAEILGYWFGSEAGDAATAKAQRKLWWSKDETIDADIRARFADRVAAAATGAHDDWAATPRGRLALILLLDQFPRNMYRDSPQAFACDPLACKLALDGIAAGADQSLRPIERVFCYLPLEHAESLELQERCVELFKTLLAGVPAQDKPVFSGYLDYALRHREIIQRFGRFPHRNRILGRASTQEETVFLNQPGSAF